MTPKVSVILPTRNRAATLGRAMDSVLSQTFPDFELIVVDDGSNDDTAKLVASRKDKRVRYIHNTAPHSASRARNAGLRLARAPFIAFQDSDDEWLPRKLQVQVSRLDSLPAEVGMVYCPVRRVSIDGTSEKQDAPIFTAGEPNIFPRVLSILGKGIGTQTVLARAEVFQTVGGFDEGMRAIEDLELFIRISRYYRFEHIEECLVRYYETPGSLSYQREAVYDGCLAILKKHGEEIYRDPNTAAVYHRALGRCLVSTPRAAESRRWTWKLVRAGKAGLQDFLWLLLSFTGRRIHENLLKLKSLMRRRPKSA